MPPRPPSAREFAVVDALLPGTPVAGASVVSGGSHDVVLLPGLAAVRIARHRPAVEALPRRTALLATLAGAGLPFATPEPLGPVVSTPGWTAVAVSWVPGHEPPKGDGDPVVLRRLLGVLDWDLAHAFDPAVDVACPAYTHGWPVIERTVDAATYRRARVWSATFSIEQLVKYLLDGVDDATMDRYVANVTRWMDTDGHG